PPSRRPSRRQQRRRPTGAPGTFDPTAATKERNNVLDTDRGQVRAQLEAQHTMRSGGPAVPTERPDLLVFWRLESLISTL
ncbi:MAG: hypothetical protein Q8L22_19875, partial [Reyranella sp.]|nr:hypothetical protein [Reyranella sp.]